MEFKEVKIEVYIPEKYIESLRGELNEIGACHIGDYDNCISVIESRGYWRPLKGASPFSGEIDKICSELECKVELRCRFEHIQEAIDVIKRVHPYEEPVFNIVPLINYMFKQNLV